jgi:hypothetical protein
MGISRPRPGIGVKKTMFTIFFTNRKLLMAEDLPKGQKYNQDYKRTKQSGTFYSDTDHSKSHDSAKIQGKFDTEGPARSPYPAYSRDLSPRDFWFFGMAKGEMKDR